MSTFKSLKFNQTPLVGFIKERQGFKQGGRGSYWIWNIEN